MGANSFLHKLTSLGRGIKIENGSVISLEGEPVPVMYSKYELILFYQHYLMFAVKIDVFQSIHDNKLYE